MDRLKLKNIADLYFVQYNENEINSETLLEYLKTTQDKIADIYNYNCHREDIINELSARNYDINKIPADLLDNMTYYYEKALLNYGYDSGWIYILGNTIDDYENKLKKYINSNEKIMKNNFDREDVKTIIYIDQQLRSRNIVFDYDTIMEIEENMRNEWANLEQKDKFSYYIDKYLYKNLEKIKEKYEECT